MASAMSESGQDRPNEEHRPNDRFVIRKRPLAKDTMNGRSWVNRRLFGPLWKASPFGGLADEICLDFGLMS
jgi:hypothetical protein